MTRDVPAEIEALRAATREAHEVLRDLRIERRAIGKALDDVDGKITAIAEELRSHWRI
jgi:hypothetical protein